VHNETLFCEPHRPKEGRYYPGFSVRHALPENRKSQFLYLRPDMGTKIFRYEDQLPELVSLLGISLGRTNQTHDAPPPPLRPSALDDFLEVFRWDLAYGQYTKLAWPR
jgi:hypothetical protein